MFIKYEFEYFKLREILKKNKTTVFGILNKGKKGSIGKDAYFIKGNINKIDLLAFNRDMHGSGGLRTCVDEIIMKGGKNV